MPTVELYRDEQIAMAQQAILQISDIWVEPAEGEWEPLSDDLCSEVRFVHEWEGRLMLECSRPLAAVLSASMLMRPIEEIGDTDVQDVIGELLNTIAGNLKCLLPADTELTIPVTGDRAKRIEGTVLTGQVCQEDHGIVLACEIGAIRLSFWHC
ncbi:chemotaxis protein CheX [Silvibacterium sp.]|uniref:chemotaxis protein CheX n=1 Tax=Silvibacterium sp. TaxID=1964179 RepID=UPI0039E53E81